MDVDDLVLSYIERTTESDELRTLVQDSLYFKNSRNHVEVLINELSKTKLTKIAESQINRFSQHLVDSIGDDAVLNTMFKVNLHDNYRQISGVSQSRNIINSFDRLLHVLVLTRSVTRDIFAKHPQLSDNLRRMVMFGITDICVGFLNRHEIHTFIEEQGIEISSTDSETESCCSSSSECSAVLGSPVEILSNTTGTPIQIQTPVHDIISLDSCEDVSSVVSSNNHDSELNETSLPLQPQHSFASTLMSTNSYQTVLHRQDTTLTQSQLLPALNELNNNEYFSDQEEAGIAMDVLPKNKMKRQYKGSPNGSGLSTPKRHASASSHSSAVPDGSHQSWNLHNLGTIASIAIVSFGVMMLAKPTTAA